MSRLITTYIAVASVIMAISPWLFVAAVAGTEDTPVSVSIICSTISLSSIFIGILITLVLDDYKSRMEFEIKHLKYSNESLKEEMGRAKEAECEAHVQGREHG